MVTTQNDVLGKGRVHRTFAVATVIVAAVLVAATGTAGASHQISSCADDVTSSGLHTVGSDISDAGATSCINVTVSDVVLDGQNHTVDGVDNDVGSIGVNVMNVIDDAHQRHRQKPHSG